MIRALALADRTVYESTLQALLDTHMSKEMMQAKIDSLTALIEPHVENDPDLDVEEWRGSVG